MRPAPAAASCAAVPMPNGAYGIRRHLRVYNRPCSPRRVRWSRWEERSAMRPAPLNAARTRPLSRHSWHHRRAGHFVSNPPCPACAPPVSAPRLWLHPRDLVPARRRNSVPQHFQLRRTARLLLPRYRISIYWPQGRICEPGRIGMVWTPSLPPACAAKLKRTLQDGMRTMLI